MQKNFFILLLVLIVAIAIIVFYITPGPQTFRVRELPLIPSEEATLPNQSSSQSVIETGPTPVGQPPTGCAQPPDVEVCQIAFGGRVVEKLGQGRIHDFAYWEGQEVNLYKIEVLSNIIHGAIRGYATGTIIVADFGLNAEIRSPIVGETYNFYTLYHSGQNWYVSIGPPLDDPAAKMIEVESFAEYATDLSISEHLLGGSHYVFVAKIIKEIQSNGWVTEFEAEVITNIKGNLSGTVTVVINGGYRNGIFYVVEGGTYLRPGSTYLLATRYSAENSYLVLQFPQPVSWKLVSQDDGLTKAQLVTFAESDLRVKQLQAAYPREILLDADIYHNNTRNSYQFLTEAQKVALPYYTPLPMPRFVTSSTTNVPSSTGN